MKYKAGDKVRIKSLDWYNENKDEDGDIGFEEFRFVSYMSEFCGKILTIDVVFEDETYLLKEDADGFVFTDEMIEGLVEEETKFGTTSNPTEIKSNANCLTRERVDELATKIDKELPSGNPYEWECPEGYQFKDENGNVINATKIVLEKKKKEYPKTYEECYKVLGIEYLSDSTLEFFEHGSIVIGQSSYQHDNLALINTFVKLKLCRDAYWKIAGEEMGLEKPWSPDYTEESYEQGSPIKYVIYYSGTDITKGQKCTPSYILSFPTPEMRDAFKEYFDPDLEFCKELL